MTPSGLAEARSAGSKRYTSDLTCPKGHVGERYTVDQSCCECRRLTVAARAQRGYYERNRDRLLVTQRASWHRRSESITAADRSHHRDDPRREMVLAAAKRAKRDGTEFDLRFSDFEMPEVCPVLSIPLSVGEGKLHAGSPSLDRIDPSRGYVKDNVWVISHRANRAKQDLSLDELRALVAALESRH